MQEGWVVSAPEPPQPPVKTREDAIIQAVAPAVTAGSIMDPARAFMRSVVALSQLSPLNALAVFLIFAFMFYILYQEAISGTVQKYMEDLKSYERWWREWTTEAPEPPPETHDGTDRNKYSRVEEDNINWNIRSDPMMCRVFGVGCTSRPGDEFMFTSIEDDALFPIGSVNSPPDGYVEDGIGTSDLVNVDKGREGVYRNVADDNSTKPSMDVNTAITQRNLCKDLTFEEAKDFYCERGMRNQGNFRSAMSTTWACSREVEPRLCSTWQVCMENIAIKHFSTKTPPLVLQRFFQSRPYLGKDPVTNEDIYLDELQTVIGCSMSNYKF